MPTGQEETNLIERRWQELHRISLVVQWLRPCTFTVEGTGLIPGWGTKIPYVVVWPKKKKKKTHILAAKLMLNAIFKEKWKKKKTFLKLAYYFSHR